jgi:hypothetical protein
MPRIISALRWSIIAQLFGSALGGCVMGPLPSSYSGPVTGSIGAGAVSSSGQAIEQASTGLGEIRSSTCAGLALERQERLQRIAQLQTTVVAELASPPATLAQAVQRATGNPEEGTAAFKDISVERTQIASIASVAGPMGCPPGLSAPVQ